MRRASMLLILLATSSVAFGQSMPKWLEEARAREAAPARPSRIESADGWLGATVPFPTVGKVESSDGWYSVTLALTKDVVVNCEISRDTLDLGALLAKTSDSSFDLIAKQQGKVGVRAIERLDAGAVGSSPLLAVDWIYRVDSPDGARVGSLKQVVAAKAGHGIYCAHNDIGFSKSFETAVRELVQSIQFADASKTPAPVYEDVMIASVGTQRLGVATTRVLPAGDGDYRMESMSALLVPGSASTLRSQDSYTVQFSRADRSMINAVYVMSENGEVSTNLRLDGREGGGWKVSGTFKGKKLDADLAAEPAPTSALHQAERRRALLAREQPVGAEESDWQWLPDDPLKFTPIRTRVVSAAEGGAFNVLESTPALEMTSVVERATGLQAKMGMAMGAQSASFDRVFVSGHLP